MVKLADRVHNLSQAHFASSKWINKYTIETKQWYLEMAIEPHLKKLLQIY